MNWAVKLLNDQQELFRGFTEAEAGQMVDELRARGFEAELVDVLEPLRNRLPIGRRVCVRNGAEGVVVEQAGAAHAVDHVGGQEVCIRLDGRPSTWFTAGGVVAI